MGDVINNIFNSFRIRPKQSFTIALLIFLMNTVSAFATVDNELRTHFTVTIDMDKTVYHVGEPLQGEVVIKSTAPATLPGGFKVHLYHEDELRYEVPVFVDSIATGTTKIAFAKFGIPLLRPDERSLGNWQIIIHPLNKPGQAARADFAVKPSKTTGD